MTVLEYTNLTFFENKEKNKTKTKKDLLLSGRTKINKIEKTISKAMRPKKKLKNSCFRTVGEKKNLHPGGRRLFFQSIFRRYSLFFLGFFCFFCILIFLACFSFYFFFLILKTYILIRIRLCRWVRNKKIFTRPICGNKTTLFGLIDAEINQEEFTLVIKKAENYHKPKESIRIKNSQGSNIKIKPIEHEKGIGINETINTKERMIDNNLKSQI